MLLQEHKYIPEIQLSLQNEVWGSAMINNITGTDRYQNQSGIHNKLIIIHSPHHKFACIHAHVACRYSQHNTNHLPKHRDGYVTRSKHPSAKRRDVRNCRMQLPKYSSRRVRSFLESNRPTSYCSWCLSFLASVIWMRTRQLHLFPHITMQCGLGMVLNVRIITR